MPVRKKELLNAPKWMDKIENLDKCARIARFLKNNRQEAYSLDEIRKNTSVHSSLTSATSLEKAGLVGVKAGMYYVEDESKCKKLIKLADI
jgi:hypothetical protein